MNIKHSLLIAVTSLSALTAANAQEKVEVKVTGRALFDAATYSQNDATKTQDGTMNDRIGIRDMRIGFKAYYGDNWYFRGDASFTNNKVSLKDVYLQYSFNKNNFIRAGHYTVPFGLSSAYSSAIYRASHQAPIAYGVRINVKAISEPILVLSLIHI